MVAARDENDVPTLIGALSTNGTTVTRAQVTAATHRLKVEDSSSGSSFGPVNALHDDNMVPTLLGASRSNGTTPIAAYIDSQGRLLVDSN